MDPLVVSVSRTRNRCGIPSQPLSTCSESSSGSTAGSTAGSTGSTDRTGTRALVRWEQMPKPRCRVRPPVPRVPIDLRQTARESRKMVHHQSPARCQGWPNLTRVQATSSQDGTTLRHLVASQNQGRRGSRAPPKESNRRGGTVHQLAMDKNLTAQPYNHRKRRRRIDRAGEKVTG